MSSSSSTTGLRTTTPTERIIAPNQPSLQGFPKQSFGQIHPIKRSFQAAWFTSIPGVKYFRTSNRELAGNCCSSLSAMSLFTTLVSVFTDFARVFLLKALAPGAPPQTPVGELTALPHTPLQGGRGAPLPHPPRDRGGYRNFLRGGHG